MAWSTPLTAVSNATVTAAQWNASVRDNLLTTAPALASAAGQLFVATGTNTIAARTPTAAVVATSETTTTLTYTDLATVGPAVTVTTGAKAIVAIACEIDNNATNAASSASYAVSGATTVAASNAWRIARDGTNLNNPHRYSAVSMQQSLTPGSNTFTMKYLAGSNTARFAAREIVVIPL